MWDITPSTTRQRPIHCGDQLVDGDAAVGVETDRGTCRHCRSLERDVDAADQLVDGHRAALIAVARKLLVILNAMIRDKKPWQYA